MNITEYRRIHEECTKAGVRLVAVSKTRSADEILEVYQEGQRDFGENRVQEWMDKKDKLPPDIHWHLIGHLQTNKLKYLDPVPYLIHSGDRDSLLQALEKEGAARNVIFNVLLQVKVASEESKYGYAPDDVLERAQHGVFQQYQHIRFYGVMGMATFTDDMVQVAGEFHLLKQTFNQLKPYFKESGFHVVSMGMSGDYLTAIQEGSTMVRVGSSIFGERQY